MSLPPPTICRRIRKLHAMLGSPQPGERESAHGKLTALLTEHCLTWNDLPEILAAASEQQPPPPPPPPSGAAPPGSAPSDGPQVNVFDLVERVIELHFALTPEQRTAVALWILHSYLFGRFQITPRLALVSPVRGCGKTTLLVLLEQLTADPYRSDHVTPAAVYHEISKRERSLLIDEGDNLGLHANNVLRAIFNAGHRRGGAISRFVGGWSKKFAVFSPMAIATIGMLPLPLMHRAIIISMQRRSRDVPLQQLDEYDPTFPAVRAEIVKWVATCALNPNPEMPAKLHNRAADNWRVLLSIADDLGRGESARAAAIALSTGRLDEDLEVVLLGDIQTVFAGRDRISSAALVAGLVEIEGGHWHDWRGPRDNRAPHHLTQSELALLLRPFGIRPRTVWPAGRLPGSKSRRGYLRLQFEEAWRAYCPGDTPTQSSKIRRLHEL